MEEIVSCYSFFRPLLLDHLKEDGPIEKLVEHTPEIIEIISDSESKLPSSSSPKEATPRNVEADQEPSPRKMKITPPPNDFEPTPKKIKISPNGNSTPNSQLTVSCPVCSKQMTAEHLQSQHLDECLLVKPSSPRITSSQVPKKKAASISLFFQPRKPVNKPKINHEQFYFNDVKNHKHEEVKRLPKVDFNSLTTPKLKEKLSALKLPIQGTRHQLELRYNQYYILFNSNLDSNHPVPEKILKQRLNQWELSHLAFTSSASSSLFSIGSSLSNKSLTDKDFLVKLWMDTYRQEFKELVKQAKSSIRQPADSKQAAENVVAATGPTPTTNQ